MSKVMNIQDSFLNQSRKDKVLITIYLMNGVPIKGRVIGFDNFTVLLDKEGKQHIIYKHAISTILPDKKVDIFAETEMNEKK